MAKTCDPQVAVLAQNQLIERFGDVPERVIDQCTLQLQHALDEFCDEYDKARLDKRARSWPRTA